VLKLLANFIPGTKGVGHKTELYGVPYSLSEDFVSSYRMHPLIPDEYVIDGQKVTNSSCHATPNCFQLVSRDITSKLSLEALSRKRNYPLVAPCGMTISDT
jgi:hypothetical protein